MVKRRRRTPGFCPLEGEEVEDEIAWQSPWGRWKTRLAHRVLRHVEKIPGRQLGHPRRRPRPDLPHHENEIAQSEAHNGKPYVNYWMHNGYITVDKEK